MNKKLPSMPGMNQNLSDDVDTASSSISPTPEVSKDASGLEVPEHKVQFENVDDKNESIIVAPKISKSGIEVVALRKGFYNQERIKEGQVFLVKKMEDLGEWMKCLDVDTERKRLEILKSKKAK
jgi:hypothetical protein